MMGHQSRQMAMIFVDIESLIPETHLNAIFRYLPIYYSAGTTVGFSSFLLLSTGPLLYLIVPYQRKRRPAGAWAAESNTGRESRLWAEPCREKNSGAAHCTPTVRPWRHNDHSAERQFGGIGQGQPWPQERTGHDQGRAHHACSTN